MGYLNKVRIGLSRLHAPPRGRLSDPLRLAGPSIRQTVYTLSAQPSRPMQMISPMMTAPTRSRRSVRRSAVSSNR
ncbi:MAG: hypothetical protein K0S03_1681 [Burkholderiales bacterium]|nr:hypothetical protein [Burkholderiales bacterium]